ncbi:MAG: hypothetical protein Q8P67_05490, partial [archaeon]|nr:hypothetical protein [archaeon]
TLTIIDRKKNIFKLSQGEYVAAEKLESCLLKNKYVAQIFVYGDSLKSTLVAVIVPDPDTLIPWAKSQAIPNADNLDAICRDENVIKHVLKSLGETGREWQFKGFEFIRAVHLEPEAFSVEQDLLTPTHKNKRPQLTRHYHNVFDQLYASIPE